MIYRIDKEGNFYLHEVDTTIAQDFINQTIGKLGKDYFNIENECREDAVNDPRYKTLFNRNSIRFPITLFKEHHLGKINNYQYYEDIYFDERYQVYNSLKLRVNMNWEFKYIIFDFSEILPYYIIKKINKII